MTREMAALLLCAAKACGYGAVGVDAKRAREFGVPVGTLVRAGEIIPGGSRKATTTGYYCPRSNPLGVPGQCLCIEAYSPGDGRTLYRLDVLDETGTHHGSFAGRLTSLGAAEMRAYLRGVADGGSLRGAS